MTQELTDLRASILEGRYADALVFVDELEGISKQATLRNIEFFLLAQFGRRPYSSRNNRQQTQTKMVWRLILRQ